MRTSSLSLFLLTVTLYACKDDAPSGDSAEDTEITGGDSSGGDSSGGDSSAPEDKDGDGFPAEEDCDDNDAAVNPGAAEVCDGRDNDCDGLTDLGAADAQVFYGDDDGDGYAGDEVTVSACEAPEGFSDTITDCDDLRDDVNPAAPERCDGRDNDCDGLTDDDDDTLASGEGSAWLPDGDGDGYGDSAGAAVTACAAPAGYVAEGGDCDDADQAIAPSATETCDALDNDCDGLTDDDDPSVDTSDGLAVYLDGDGDGFGLDGTGLMRCALPAGYVADMSDCDDLSATVNPAATEVCDGGVDNDCDGLTDDDDPSVDTSAGVVVYLDGDGDGFGLDGTGLMRCVLPSGYATLDGDCDDSAASVSPDGVEVCDNGLDDDCSGDAVGCGISGALSPSDANLTYTDATSAYVGYELGAGDLNGDGHDDLVIGAYGATVGSAAVAGRSYILYGPHTSDRTLTTSYDATIDGAVSYDYAGRALASGGDMDGDGYDDLVIGAYGYDSTAGAMTGLAGLRYGGATPLSGSDTLDTLDASFAGHSAGDYLGDAVRFIGDMNGDGYDELAVSARGTYSSFSGLGTVYVIPGSATRYSGMSTVTKVVALRIVGASSGDAIGGLHSIAGPIDLDGDGLNDLVMGSGSSDSGTASNNGGVYVFHGVLGTMYSTTTSTKISSADVSFLGEATGDSLGEAPERAGDVNGDGYDDLVLGANGADTGASDAGCAYLIHGGSTRLSGAKSVASAAAATMCGSSASGFLGTSVGGADLNGDGYSDVYTGAPRIESGSTSAVGAMYVFYGPLSGSVSASAADATFTGTSAYGYAGRGAHTADANSDGIDDLLFGAYGAGAVYTLFGGGL